MAGIDACVLANNHVLDWGRPGLLDTLQSLDEAGIRRGGAGRDAVEAEGNWGYEIPRSQREFAHRLIDDAGVDIVHGHSSHHPKAIEIYRDRPILYGCGDFVNDYEGIAGYEAFRDDLVFMYLPRLAVPSGRLLELCLIPFQIRRFRLNRASPADAAWLGEVLDRENSRLGTRVEALPDRMLKVTWR